MKKIDKTYWNPMVPELTVMDFSTSLNFYTEILGFNIMFTRTGPNFAYINLGQAQFMLEQYHSTGWNIDEIVRPLGRGINFQIEVDDITSLFDRVNAQGIKLFRGLKDNVYYIEEKSACQREFLVQDPDGYLLRFSQFIE